MFHFPKMGTPKPHTKFDDEIEAIPMERWIKIGVSDKYCSYCGEALVEYSIPSNNPIRRFDAETGKPIVNSWLLCPNRKLFFSSLYWDCLESERHDGRMIKPATMNQKTANEKMIYCAYCGAIMDDVECAGCGARIAV